MFQFAFVRPLLPLTQKRPAFAPLSRLPRPWNETETARPWA